MIARQLLVLLAVFAIAGCSSADPAAASGASADAAGADSSKAGLDSASADVAAKADIAAVDAPPSTDSAGDTTAAPTSYGIGVLVVESKGAAGRVLPTTIWYPAVPGSTGDAAKYFLDMVPSPGGAIVNAPAAKGPFPLIAFSHGNGGIRDQSFYLCEALAAHGYVVVAPDHVQNTFADLDNTLLGVMTIWRPKDIKGAIDRALTPQAGDPQWLTGLVDPKLIGMTGHSFGGYTSLAIAGALFNPPAQYLPICLPTATDPSCVEFKQMGPPPWNLSDPRVKVAVPLAHAFTAGFEVQSLKNMKIPIILEAALGDTLTPMVTEALPMYGLLGGPKALITIQGGGHYTFANMCELPSGILAQMASEIGAICDASTIPTITQSHDAIVVYELAAFDLFLRGDKSKASVFAAGKPTDLPVTVSSDGIAP